MKTKVCPNCGEAKDVEYKPTAFEASQGISATYTCNNCGFKSRMFPEIEK